MQALIPLALQLIAQLVGIVEKAIADRQTTDQQVLANALLTAQAFIDQVTALRAQLAANDAAADQEDNKP